jgi:hypothetical protein
MRKPKGWINMSQMERASEKLKTILLPENNWSGEINLKNGKKVKIERDNNGFYHLFAKSGDYLNSLGRMDWNGMVKRVLKEGE